MALQEAESSLSLILDTTISQKEKLEEFIDVAYDQGFSFVSLPLVDPKQDNASLIESKNDDNVGSQIPFINYGYSSDANSQLYACIFGKLSQWITFRQSDCRLTVNSTDKETISIPNQRQLGTALKGNINDETKGNEEYSNDNDNVACNDNGGKLAQFFDKRLLNGTLGASEELLLKYEINMAHHLGMSNLILPPLTDEKNIIPVKYASGLISSMTELQFMLGIVPVYGNEQGWKNWLNLTKLLTKDIQNMLQPAIILTSDVPSIELQNEWFSYGLSYFYINNDIFLTNSKNYPVLSKLHQSILRRHMRVLNTYVILSQKDRNVNIDSIKHYVEYMRHLRQTVLPLTDIEMYSKSYWDVLQTPLQPLYNNLDYTTYETFEKDSIKYIKYQEAITLALNDLNDIKNAKKESNNKNNNNNNNKTKKGGSKNDEINGVTTTVTDSENENENDFEDMMYEEENIITIFVLGAGRGPLVDAAINASIETNIPIMVYAIEKNPYATVILKSKEKNIWNKNSDGDDDVIVKVISKDMREWKPPCKADIIVSELLGSFGDNELSPECLNDVINNMLNEDYGINIPCKYTSYIAPISYFHVWRRLKEMPRDFEIPHVVNLTNFRMIDNDQACWVFEHFNNNDNINNKKYSNINKKNENTHNARYAEIEFNIKKNSICHGFAGYFDAVLYKNVMLSIRPQTHTPEMFSWFPMYFPLKDPVLLKDGGKLVAHFWRKVSKEGVWYEWCITQPTLSDIHNPCHRSYIVKL